MSPDQLLVAAILVPLVLLKIWIISTLDRRRRQQRGREERVARQAALEKIRQEGLARDHQG